MRFFGLGNKSASVDPAVAQADLQYAKRSIEALEAGHLPLRAQERLAKIGADHTWSSDLSVNEFLSVSRAGFKPVGQVLGASIYHIAYNVMRNQQWGDGEIVAYSQALYHAKELALGRMRQEAALLGAHGVVGVRLEQKEYEWGANLIEFMAIGTAVKVPGVAPLPTPFLSDMSGQDVLILMHAGYVPVDVAIGNCAYYCQTQWAEEQMMRGFGWGSYSNMEMRHFSDSMQRARHGAMRSMSADAHQRHADGIVGSNMSFRIFNVMASRASPYSNEYESIEDHVFEFSALGTSVLSIGSTHPTPHAALVIDLA